MVGARRFSIGVALLIGSAVSAQTIRGTVRDSATGAMVPGVVVSQLDDRGAVLARAVTDPGGFAIVLRPETKRLNFRRIGFAPVDTGPPVGQRLDIVMRRVATQLAPMQTTNDRRCNARDDRARAVALWEEARSSMLATTVARETREATATILGFRYEITPGSGRRTPQTVARTQARGAGRILGAAKPPAEFARDGYRVDSAGTDIYYAPDEVVLRDESFLATHCFSIAERPRGDDSTVAIHFAPDRNRKNVDIEGEAVLRKDPLELLRIDFRYIGTEDGFRRLRLGGFLRYETMPIGVSMATHWHMRVPVQRIVVHSSVGFDTVRNVRTQRSLGSSLMTTAQETGAVLERIEWDDGTAWRFPLPTLTGRVVRKGRGSKPEAGLEAVLFSSPYSALTDSSGEFTMRNVLPGVYTFVGRDSVGRFGVVTSERKRIEVDSTGVTTADQVDVEQRDGAIASACSARPPYDEGLVKGPGGPSVILGRIDGRLTGLVPYKATIRREGSSDSVLVRGTTGGTFRICGIPRDRTVTITIDGPHGPLPITLEVKGPLHFVTLKLTTPR